MTYKTDLKFGLLILAILAGTCLFAVSAIRSKRLTYFTDLEAKLYRNMGRVEVESLMGKYQVRRIGSTPSTIMYTLTDPSGDFSRDYHFFFNSSDHVTRVTVDDQDRPNHYINRTLALK